MATATLVRPPINAVTASQQLSGLHDQLLRLVGERFRLARFSYGDELTLHFGELVPGRSARTKHLSYGKSILGLRSSPWIVKDGTGAVLIAAGLHRAPNAVPIRLTGEEKREFETQPLLKVDSRVARATPFAIAGQGTIGLELVLSDGSTFSILPEQSVPDAIDGGNSELPEISDWELVSPAGRLSVGPGPVWTFEPKKSPADSETDSSTQGERHLDI